MTNENDLISPEDHSKPDDFRYRMRFQFQDLVEDLIEDGRRRGLFDDLSGHGRPLNLEKNVYEGSNALANQLMKDNDIRPAWLSQRLGVAEKIDALRADISRSWTRYRDGYDHAPADHRTALSIGWDDACRRWEETIVSLNKEIETYNLKRPTGQLELFKLRLSDELQRVDAPRYLL
jgi:DnaJ family protein C protein 28